MKSYYNKSIHLITPSSLSFRLTCIQIFFWTTCILLLLSISVSGQWTYKGCFEDKPDIQLRALPYVQEQGNDFTIAKCQERCGSLGFEYSGIEYEFECYCSKHPSNTVQLEEARCNIECKNPNEIGKKCGGAAAVSVYHNPSVTPPQDNRKLVCLVMIIKNEAHTIMATLQSVKDYVDCWYILDTGSDDGTQKLVTDYMNDKPGKLFEEPFLDYGATRNRILILAKETENPVFTLMLSADETITNPSVMRAFLQDMRYSAGTMHNAYPVVMNTGLKFDSIRLARVDGGWRYKARVHEYLAPAVGPYVALYRSAIDIDVPFVATDGPRRFKSQWFIKKLLEEDLDKDPYDTRSIYYLARTCSGINNHTGAYYYYDLLAQRSKWDEEVYHGLTMKALEAKFIDIGWRERQTMLLDAYNYKPISMDALHSLAQDHFDSGRFQLAYLFMLRAVQIPVPAGLTVVENVLLRPTKHLYDFEGNRLLGFSANEVGEWQTCYDAFSRVLVFNPSDGIVAERKKICEDRLIAMGINPNPTPKVNPTPVSTPVVVETPLNQIPEPPKKRIESLITPDLVEGKEGNSVLNSLSHGFSSSFTFNLIFILVLGIGFMFFAVKKFPMKKIRGE